MKRSIRIIIPILLALAIIACSAWYLFIYDREFTRDMLLTGARFFESQGNHVIATWFYDRAYEQADNSDVVAIELAQQYADSGNYTMAERTLNRALSDESTTPLYIALCKTYVAQDKLLDAVELLSNIRNPEIAAKINLLRPEAPTAYPTPGFYSQYINITVEAEGGKLYANPSGVYPSVKDSEYEKPIPLVSGENAIYSLVVADNGLVSPLSIFAYTIGGVVEEVKFADPAIETDIRNYLGVKDDKVLYSDDLWDLKSFTVPKNATTFADLKHMQFVEELIFTGGPSGEMGCLSGMKDLSKLTVRGINLTADDLKVIGSLPALEELTISECNLSTTTGLETAVNLVRLDLSNNALRNLSAISSMEKLQSLNLQRNAIKSLDALSGCAALSYLDVSYNSIVDLSPIAGLAKLQTLDAGSNTLEDLPDFSTLSCLSYLSLSYNKLSDVSTLAYCTSLTDLNISHNSLVDIAALSALNNLTVLNFSHNLISEIPAFQTSCNLITIDGSNNKIESLWPLAGLTQLNNVLMDYNESIYSVECLKNCPVLIKVNVYGTGVKEAKMLTDQSVIVNYDPT